MNNDHIAFIGGGNMTRAIVGGLLAGGFEPGHLHIAEPLADARDRLAAEFPGVHIDGDNDTVAAAAGCVVLAVKPQILPAVCRGLRPTLCASRPLIVSIAAGVRSSDIDSWLGGGFAVVRVMPNQPALLRRGMSGLCANAATSDAQRSRAVDIMSAVGRVVEVADDDAIDAVTAVSGSGPAYFFLLIDMLQSAAVELGIDAAAARTLAIETAAGAAELAAAADEPMADLIARVRSPGGTTAAALDSLEDQGVRAIFSAAVRKARDRAVELADAAHASTITDTQ